MMLYNSNVLLLQGCKNIASKYTRTINEALYMTMPSGSVDIYFLRSAQTLMDIERLIRQTYEVARQEASKIQRESVYVTVLVDGRDFELQRPQEWEAVVTGNREPNNASELRRLVPDISDIQKLPVVVVRMDDDDVDSDSDDDGPDASPQTNESEEHRQLLYTHQCEHNVVAVGGTFDHLHDGHKLILTMAGYLARERLIVGITGPELLKNKKYAQAMQSYAKRKEILLRFMQYVFPTLKVDCYMINDVYGPTAKVEAIDALIVSRETRSGGEAINKMRREKEWNELHIYEVDLIGSSSQHSVEDKLSSTELRRRELEQLSINEV